MDLPGRGRRFLEALAEYLIVDVAFWARPNEDGRWYLYVASPELNSSNFDVAYGEVIRLCEQMDAPRLDPFRVNLVWRDDDALVRTARRYGKPDEPTWCGESQVPYPAVEGMYVYPLAREAAAA